MPTFLILLEKFASHKNWNEEFKELYDFAAHSLIRESDRAEIRMLIKIRDQVKATERINEIEVVENQLQITADVKQKKPGNISELVVSGKLGFGLLAVS